MSKLRKKLKDLFSLQRLKEDGGTLWRDPNGKLRGKRIAKFSGGGVVFLGSLVLAIASIGLPFPGQVQARGAEASIIYARDGTTELYRIRGDKDRTPIAFEQMPKCIKDATVAAEDKTFYKHSGLDPRGVARAILVNLEFGQTTQGGSTITQQLVKNALLSPERTYTRKAKELILSLEIEQMFSKDRILELYLNEIPYGSSAYGVQAASQTYFGKNAKDLSVAECAALASLPRAPTFYSPYTSNDPSRLQERATYVLEQMQEQGYISEQQAAEAKQQVETGLQFAAAKGEDIKAPHFVFYVREQLERDYGAKTVQEGGLKVVTTLDVEKQDIAEDVIQKSAESKFRGYGASNAALTSIDPKTGQIVAMVGSVDYFNTEGEGNVNVATSERQPGSSFKPIVYLAGFKKAQLNNLEKPLAVNPATLLWDVETDFGGGYSPENYDGKFRGPVSARDALQQSLNVPAVKMLDLIGVRTATDLAHQMGISTLNDPDRYGDSLVLGGGEIKLVDLTSAYGVMANEGVAAYDEENRNGTHTTSTAILQVNDRKGKELYKYSDKSKREVFSEDLAYQISDVLSDDAARAPQFGRGGPLTLDGRDAAAKTGTTDSFRDAWTVGYTPQLVAGVWIGNNDNSPMNRVGGSLGAAPIWNEYMERALEGEPNEKFEQPPGIKEMQVDRLTGLLPQANGATKTDIFTADNAPREKSSVQTTGNAECAPEVSIVSPSSGSIPAGPVSIQATASAQVGIKQVEFSVDGSSIGSDDTAPFTASTSLSSGSHTITATATGDCDQDVESSSLHSERPNNPNWENPVQAYIRTHGIKIDEEQGAEETATATDSINVTVSGGNAQPSPKPSATPVTIYQPNMLALLRNDRLI